MFEHPIRDATLALEQTDDERQYRVQPTLEVYPESVRGAGAEGGYRHYERRATLIAEPGIGGILISTGRTYRGKCRSTLITELGVRGVFRLALETLHPALPHVWERHQLRFIEHTL